MSSLTATISSNNEVKLYFYGNLLSYFVQRFETGDTLELFNHIQSYKSHQILFLNLLFVFEVENSNEYY
ncbi:hypothetical protein SLEP1_g4009 [Rubroshorea leprosula]|uniref:Uncharacterized protein n=1 Tax=Rubroshorea leprosula TaxID=152421 RepID=A0AAV5HUW3_9ROSI|nr:hypothetical protein SLEP1_g4009 [Rubroshorea leprosula]